MGGPALRAGTKRSYVRNSLQAPPASHDKSPQKESHIAGTLILKQFPEL